MLKITLVLFILGLVFAVDPPNYNYPFHITFDEEFITEKGRYTVNGQTYYDPRNNRERVDRANGRYDLFCGSVL